MNLVNSADFVADRPWGALDLAALDDATVRLHWTDQPYHWHTNDGAEVFVVLDGIVDMHYTDGAGAEQVEVLTPGRVCVIGTGDRHVAMPRGAARILVVERRDSE